MTDLVNFREYLPEHVFFVRNGAIVEYKETARGRKAAFEVSAFLHSVAKKLPSSIYTKMARLCYGDEAAFLTRIQTECQIVIEDVKGGSPLFGETNFLYLRFLDKNRTNCEILLLINEVTNTFLKLGQTLEDKIYSKINTACRSCQNLNVRRWYNELLARARLRDIKSYSIALDMYIQDLYSQDDYHLEEILNISNDAAHPNYAFYNLGAIVNLHPADTTAWDEFLSMFSTEAKRKLFMAWMWSIFDGANTGRQWLWVQGNGYEGKSTMYSALLRYMDRMFGVGKAYFATTNTSHESNFFFSQAEGKRLCVFGDTRESGLLRNETFLRLSGFDHVVVEAKHKDAYTAKVYSKLLFFSNYMPIINFSSKAEMSRILVLRLDPLLAEEAKKNRIDEAGYGHRLYDQIESFLCKCYSAYQEMLKPGSYDFIIPDDVVKDMMAHCMTKQYVVEQQFIKHCLEFSEDYHVPQVQLENAFDKFREGVVPDRDLYFSYNNIRMTLEEKHRCYKASVKIQGGVQVPVVRGVRLNPKAPTRYEQLLFALEDEGKSLPELLANIT